MTSLRRILPAIGFGALIATSLTCNGEGPSDPGGEPAAMAPVSGEGQAGLVGTELAEPLVVAVTDDAGNPVEGVSVQWSAGNGGSVSATTVATDADGHSSVRRMLGSAPGEQTTTATVGGLDGSPVQFTATAVTTTEPLVLVTPPPATALSGEVWAPSAQPVVRVQDDAGAPRAGVTVTAGIASGAGTLQGVLTAQSDANGMASFGDLGISGTGAHLLEFVAGDDNVVSSEIALSALPPEATAGKWDAPVSWNIVPLHMTLLPTGKLLAWGREEIGGGMGQPRLWDPAGAGSPAAAPVVANDTMLFCAGHALMADGKLMVSGGHKADDRGLDVTNIFDPVSESWTPGLPKMAKGRWYPTVTELADGRMVTMAGQDSASIVVKIPEVWENGAWVPLPGAGQVELPYYPRNFIDPTNGRIFSAGERITSRWLDVDASGPGGRGVWITGPSHIWPFNRDYGSAVMYESGQILYVGGGGNTAWDTPDPRASAPTATAERIDLNSGSTWIGAGSLSAPRRHLTATVLPDGQVLVTGGVSGGGFNDVGSGQRSAELWNPATPTQWTTLASNSVVRAYHSVSILLPDGTVLHGASGDANIPGTPNAYPAERSHEIFRPPYLFKGARPTITDAPAAVSPGATFTVTTPNARQITGARLIRLGAVTHAFDMNTMAVSLDFDAEAGGLSVVAPANHNIVPPGYYQLFILNRNGVPSTGRMIRIQ
jgi:hypothetical protein